MKCSICKKIKPVEEMADDKVCIKCIKEIAGGFGFFIGGKQVSKEKFDRIVKRGYVIPEELDEDREK